MWAKGDVFVRTDKDASNGPRRMYLCTDVSSSITYLLKKGFARDNLGGGGTHTQVTGFKGNKKMGKIREQYGKKHADPGRRWLFFLSGWRTVAC